MASISKIYVLLLSTVIEKIELFIFIKIKNQIFKLHNAFVQKVYLIQNNIPHSLTNWLWHIFLLKFYNFFNNLGFVILLKNSN